MNNKLIAVTVATALLLVGCSSTSENSSSGDSGKASTSNSASASYPRSIQVGDSTVELKAQPQRIAVLTPDLASLVLPMAGKQRVVMSAEMNPENGAVAADANSVDKVLKTGAAIDPEQVLSSKPDLVLISARHTGEQDAISMLKNAGVPLGVVSSDEWSSIDDLLKQIDTVGKLVGEEAKAAEMRSKIENGRKEALAQADTTQNPKVLTMMSRGGKQLFMPKTTMLNGLVRDLHATPVIDSIGSGNSVPADPEAVIKASPDVIIIQNYRGKGAEDFKALLENPALADVPAIKNKRVHYADTATTGVTSGESIIDGLKQTADFLKMN